MKFLSSKLALPVISALAVVSLVGVQAIALSQAPSDEITFPAGSVAEDQTTESEISDPQPSTTPLIIPTDGPTVAPDDDDDEYEDEDEDEYEDEDDDEYEDEDDDEYEDEDDD